MNQRTRFKQTEIGMIPEDWGISEVGEIIKHRKGYAFKSKWFQKSGRRIIKVSDFTSDSINISNSLFIEEKKAKEFKDFEIYEGDIIIATVGSWPNNPASIVGKVIRVPKGADGSLMNQNAVILRTKNDKKVNQEFLYYRLRNKDFSHHLISGAQGSANQASITLRDIFSFEIGNPSLWEQTAIAKILSDLDSKIELLQKQNKTLEAIGQAIFKHWFVDFEFPNEEGKPYKSSGGEMVFNEALGKEIPKGWETKNIQDFIFFEKGVEPGSKCYLTESSEDNIRFIRVGDISTPRREQTFIPLDLSEGKFCKEDDILLSLDATIGIVRIGMKGAHSGGVRKVYSKEKNLVPKGYIYSLLKSKHIQDTIYTYANGTTILHASESLNHMDLAVPNKEISQKFSEISEPLFNKVVNNLVEINSLEQIRDSLLPKLMSGKIRVPVEVE